MSYVLHDVHTFSISELSVSFFYVRNSFVHLIISYIVYAFTNAMLHLCQNEEVRVCVFSIRMMQLIQ